MTQMSAQIEQLKRGLLDLNGSIEAQRADNAKVRGQMEELARNEPTQDQVEEFIGRYTGLPQQPLILH